MGRLTPEAWARVRVVSWDVDGTLYDMAAFQRRLLWRFVIRLLTLRWVSAARAMARLRRFLAVMRAARRGRVDLASFAAPSYRALVDEWIVPCVAEAGPRRDLLALLDAIATSGRRQVVLSDLRAASKLEALGLTDRFSAVFEGEAVGHLKPDPALFQHVCDALGVAPHEWVHVGDRWDTDGGAVALGAHVVLISELGRLRGLAESG